MNNTLFSSTPLLPILSSSHHPQHRQHERKPPLRNKHEHAEYVQSMLEEDPEFFKYLNPPPLPYGVFVMEDGSQVLFDYHYRPIWQRPGECSRAVRADPTAWFDWVGVYWLYDHDLLPEHDEHLRDTLMLVVEEFCNGGSLWVRRWKPRYGVLVATYPIKPRPGGIM
jgi:hypothetical protein